MKEIAKIEKHLKKNYDFRYNEVMDRVEYKKKANGEYLLLQERDLNSILLDLVRAKFSISKDGLKSLLTSDFISVYNPFTEYFNPLPAVEGTKYIDQLIGTVKTHDADFFKWAFTKWLVAWVACMIEPKITNHQCIILAGKQGVGKSIWLQNLMPEGWFEDYYYAGNVKIGDKDILINLSSKALINLDELVNMTYTNVSALKELVTKNSINLRKAYGVYSESFIRRASFAASVNGQEFLYDITGNRRFISIEVFEFINGGKHGINMKQVLAEAYSLYKNGFQYWFDNEDQERVEHNNERFMVLAPMETRLLQKYSPIPLSERNPDLYKAATLIQPSGLELKNVKRFEHRKNIVDKILMELNEPTKILAMDLYLDLASGSGNRGDLGKLGKVMAKYGFSRKRTNVGVEYEVYPLGQDDRFDGWLECK